VSSSDLWRHQRAIGASKLNFNVVLGQTGYIAIAAEGTEGLLICANSYDTRQFRGAAVQQKSPVEFNNEAKHVCRDARGKFNSNMRVDRRGKGDGASKQGKAN
jgi:hypothetical protein